MHQSDTPCLISSNAGQLQDQDERRLDDHNELQLP
jgi:hypothetical protein